MNQILIVEDVPQMREWLSSLIQTRFPESKIFQAESAVELRQKLERIQPDLILLDEILGVGATEDLASLLSALITHRVVLISGMETSVYGERLLPKHVLGRIVKPNWDLGSGEERFLSSLEDLLTDLG